MEIETLDKCNLCNSDSIEPIDPGCNICRCKVCGFVFDSPRPTMAEIAEYYSKPSQYNHWLDNERPREALWKRRLRKLDKSGSAGSLLDVGAGIGQFLHLARSRFSGVYGTEISRSAIGIAREKYNLDIYAGDLMDIRFSTPPAFDNITMFHVLEHVPDPRSTVARCHSLLNRDGLLVIAVPNDIYSIKAKLKIVLRKLGANRFSNTGKLGLPKIVLDGSLSEIHLSHFRPGTLRTLLTGAGFTVIENSMDPYYVAAGKMLLLHRLHYLVCRSLMALTGVNIYDTIWMVARKS